MVYENVFAYIGGGIQNMVYKNVFAYVEGEMRKPLLEYCKGLSEEQLAGVNEVLDYIECKYAELSYMLKYYEDVKKVKLEPHEMPKLMNYIGEKMQPLYERQGEENE